MVSPPITTKIYDKAFKRLGWLGDPESLNVTPRHNMVGQASVTVPTDHKKLPLLLADGTRLVFEYRGTQILSGPIRSITGDGSRTSGLITLGVEDDIRLLWRILGIPVPANDLDHQTSEYDVRSGKAETVLKGLVSDNADRLGLPVTVAEDQERGDTIKVSVRMQPLADVLLPAVDGAGLGVTVRQGNDGLIVDVYEPQTYSKTLTEKSGTVLSWSWSKARAAVTRVIIGGQGEGTDRVFDSAADDDLEAASGDLIETFVDARDLSSATDLPARAQEALAEGAPTAGLSVELSETKHFRYGSTINRGDRVPVEVAPGVSITDVIREASLTWTRDDGFVPKPVVGDRSDDPDRALLQAISKIGRTVRKTINR